MNRQIELRRVVSAFLVVMLTAMLIVPTTLSVSAANRRFITELCVAAGEEAVDTLEADGWSVTMVGLNVTSDPASQVYLGYKFNTGTPITNVVLSPDVGDSFSDGSGIIYHCVSHVDVNEGIGGGAGCLYATHDTRVGEPLVGIDVLRDTIGEGEALYPITNDGAEIVRTQSNAPADLEAGSDSAVVYLAQIRDSIVRPYISEIGIVTDTDKWNAVYTAAERGFNYYVDGDIDGASDTYSIIAFDRTADPKEAITGITAVTARMVQSLEDEQIVDESAGQSGRATAAAITISGAEYLRTSGQPINGAEPFYIYRTKDVNAGNPISMLYAETLEEKQDFLFGTWANGYFFSPGVTTAYTYSMNEDLYETLWKDQTVLTKLPVRLLDDVTQDNVPKETAPVTEPMTEPVFDNDGEPATPDEAAVDEDTGIEEATEAETKAKDEEKGKYIKLAVLTPRDGLPDTAASLTGMRGDPSAPYVERTVRGDRVNKYQASVFGKGGVIALIIGGAVIAAAAVYVVIRKKRSAKTETKKSNNTNKSKKPNKLKKSR